MYKTQIDIFFGNSLFSFKTFYFSKPWLEIGENSLCAPKLPTTPYSFAIKPKHFCIFGHTLNVFFLQERRILSKSNRYQSAFYDAIASTSQVMLAVLAWAVLRPLC